MFIYISRMKIDDCEFLPFALMKSISFNIEYLFDLILSTSLKNKLELICM